MGGAVEGLLAVDPAALSAEARWDHLAAVDALVARACAARERALAAVHDPDDRKRWVREEVGCLLRWSLPYAEARLAQAAHVTSRLPGLWRLHQRGVLGAAQLRAAAEATYGLAPGVIAKVEARVLARAVEQTPAQFRASLRRAVAALDPAGAEARHAGAVRRDKTVRLHPLPDGMAGLWSVHPAITAEAILAAVTAAAQQLPDQPGERASLDARRADALAGLILGTHPDGNGSGGGPGGGGSPHPGVAARVQLLVPAATAAGRSDAPGELVGYGPIPASVCRAVLTTPGSTVERIPVDEAGRPVPAPGLDAHADRYRPTTRLARYLAAAHPTCRFPGCSRRAGRCELDHIVPFDGHNTTAAHRQPLCPRHHHLKHETGWTVWRDTDATTHWTSPTGRHYTKPPDELPGQSPAADP